jgi:hypothetical protein
MIMTTQQHDGPCSTHPICASRYERAQQRYYIEVQAGSLDEQSQLIEQVIGFALDTLGVRRLDMRVRGADTESLGGYTQLNAWPNILGAG